MRKARWISCALAVVLLLLALPSASAAALRELSALRSMAEWTERPSMAVPPERRADAPSQPQLRALLIGCDHFLSQADTWPASKNNVRFLADTLMNDQRQYALIRSYSDTISTVEALEEAVRSAFEKASAQDISLLYISTHGVYASSDGEISAGVLLSDGKEEELLDAATLQRILDAVPGQKVLILDACNSGAMIGKGLSDVTAPTYFIGPAYKVLCSAGGSEASWYYQSAQPAMPSGASYFATVLAYGLGGRGVCAADRNQDGLITLDETYAFLYENYAASTPQVYPQQDDFVLFSYDPDRVRAITQAITDITFQDILLTAGQSEVTFSFTVQRQVELYYQIVYHRDGAWQFSQAQHYLDGEQLDGTVLPGRKERTLSLDTGERDAYGYAMIQLITREKGQAVFQGARLLCVQPAEGSAALAVVTGGAFSPVAGEEMPIVVRHDVPCALSVSILDVNGQTVRRLTYDAPSRPQQLQPNASTYFWDGRLSSGDMAPPGAYSVQVRVRLDTGVFTAGSEAFELLP